MRQLRFQIILIVSFLLIMEILFRSYFHLRHDMPFWKTSFQNANQIYRFNHPYLPVIEKKNTTLVQGGHKVRVNNVGFRGPDVDVPKAKGSLRIVMLGGSTTWGSGVQDEESWPRLVESRLRGRYPGRKIEVINAGVPGYNSMEDLINLETRVLPLEPDIVGVYQGYNDMKVIAAKTPFEADYSHWRTRENPHDNPREFLRMYSRFVYGLDCLVWKFIGSKLKREYTKKFEDYGQLEAFKRNLVNIVAICNIHRILPILSTVNLPLEEPSLIAQRSVIDVAFSEFPKMLRAYNSQIETVAKEQGIILVEAERFLPDDETIHYDACHFTKLGNQKFADLFSEKISEMIESRFAVKEKV